MIFLLMEGCFFLTYFLIGDPHPLDILTQMIYTVISINHNWGYLPCKLQKFLLMAVAKP